MKHVLFFVIFAQTLLYNVLSEGNAYTSVTGQSLEKESRHNCDQVITEQYGEIHSPGFPDKYPRYSRCQYTIHRYSEDTCEVKLTVQRFDVAKMAFSNCSADYFEIQNDHKRYKLCGELSTGSKKFVYFPDNSDQLIFKFQSTFHQNRGFSFQIKQLPYSCKRSTSKITHGKNIEKIDGGKLNVLNETEILNKTKPEAMKTLPPPCVHVVSGRTGRITYPVDGDITTERCTYKIKKSEIRACAAQLDFSSFEIAQSSGCQTSYLKMPDGQRFCGTLGGSRKLLQFPPGSDEINLEFVSSADKSDTFDIQVTQLPGPCEYVSTTNRTGKILQQCDQTIKESTGRITSPGFPGPFGPNYRCTYTFFRPDPSVCQMELEFLSFSLGKHNPPGCNTGAFLELPGRNRLCHDLNGKMILKVSEFNDPVVFHFQSDSHTSGRGFEIITNQVPNTCPGYNVHPKLPNTVKRCYQEVTSNSGYFSSSNIHFHFPLGMPMWCEFVVHRADPTVCRLKLQISSRSFLNLPCINNFIHLPNGERMCVSVTERRELVIPNDSEYITMVYYNTNNPEFNLFVDQISNSCKSESHQSHRSKRRRWAWKIIPR